MNELKSDEALSIVNIVDIIYKVSVVFAILSATTKKDYEILLNEILLILVSFFTPFVHCIHLYHQKFEKKHFKLKYRINLTKKQNVPKQLYEGCIYNVTNHMNQLVKDGKAKEIIDNEKKVYLKNIEMPC